MARGQDLEELLGESLRNIREDRALAKVLITDLLAYIRESNRNHREVGAVAAKYVETLQRSNDQLVKITTMLKKNAPVDSSLSKTDKEELFDLLNKNDESDNTEEGS